MASRSKQYLIAFACTAAAIQATPEVAAAVVSVNAISPDPGPGRLVVIGSRQSDELHLDGDKEHYFARSPVGIATKTCEETSPTTFVCRRYSPTVIVMLGRGADELTLKSRFVGGNIGAGNGADTVIGSPGRNKIEGNGQNDEIRGGAGPDLLEGDHGSDVIVGGPGDDRLNAQDNHRDQVIDCGSGEDAARIDRRLDPEPRHCERVIKVG